MLPIAEPYALLVRVPMMIDERGRCWTIAGWAKDLAPHPGDGAPVRRLACRHQARRRFIPKNFGPWYTALADAASIPGFAAWRDRR